MPNGLVRLSSFTLGGPSRLMRLGTDSVGNHHQDREDVEVCGRLLTAEAGIAVRRGQVVVEAHGLSGAADVVHGGADDVAAKHPTKKQKKTFTACRARHGELGERRLRFRTHPGP